MKFLAKLERKFGKYAIRHLMRYVLILYVVGYLVFLISPGFYYSWLMLDIDKVLSGQVWRLLTFLIQPPDVSILFLVFFLYLYYVIGESLEAAWGSFMFNMYFLLGVIFNILSVVVIYAVTKATTGTGYSYPVTLTYINQSLFFAFAALYPEHRLLLFFFIPVKMKWLAAFEGVLLGYEVIKDVIDGIREQSIFNVALGVSIVVAMANFLIFFLIMRKQRRIPPDMARARANFRRNMAKAQAEKNGRSPFSSVAKHKCAICGRTELDDDTLEFRYCSRCVGNYEYCTEHLYTHTHVGNISNPDNLYNGGNGQ